MRLIDADHLKKWILQRWEKAYPTENLPTREVLEQIDREIAYEIVEEDIQKWIPCSERFPEPRIDVWCNSDLGQTVGYYDETCDMWLRNDYTELIVTAWMPLPEPYKEEQNDH